MKTFISGFYESSKRRRNILAKLSNPYVFVAASKAWQEYENWNLRKKLQSTEYKLNKVSFILINMTAVESENNLITWLISKNK